MKRFLLWFLCLAVFSAQTQLIRPRVFRSDGATRVSRLGHSSAEAAPSALLTDLISYYSMNGNSTDELSAYNGTDNLMSYGSGKIGLGADYPNINSNILINLALGTQFSISFWVNPYVNPLHQGARTEYGRLIGSDANNALFLHQAGAGALTLQLWIGGALKADIAMTEGVWKFVTMTATGTNVYLYVNAAEVWTGASAPNWATITKICESCSATIDEVGFWVPRVLTPAEITQLYGATAGLAYPFN